MTRYQELESGFRDGVVRRALIDDVDDVLAAGPEKKQPVPKPAQAAGKGNSARR